MPARRGLAIAARRDGTDFLGAEVGHGDSLHAMLEGAVDGTATGADEDVEVKNDVKRAADAAVEAIAVGFVGDELAKLFFMLFGEFLSRDTHLGGETLALLFLLEGKLSALNGFLFCFCSVPEKLCAVTESKNVKAVHVFFHQFNHRQIVLWRSVHNQSKKWNPSLLFVGFFSLGLHMI